MPCTSDRKVQSRVKHSRIERAARLSAESSDTSSEREEEIEVTTGPDDLDQSWSCEFKARDTAWVRVEGNWYEGSVVSSRPTIQQARGNPMGRYWVVRFSKDDKNVFVKVSPSNGDVKPDTEHIRVLLKDGGFMD